MTDYTLTSVGQSATVNGVTFEASTSIVSGTGGYFTFLAVQDNDGTEEGFNHDSAAILDTDASKTQSLLVAQMDTVTISGVTYYVLRLDMNEPGNAGGADAPIEMLEFKLYGSASVATSANFNPNQDGAGDGGLGAGFNKFYDLDSGGDNTLLMKDLSSGSGGDDYQVLIPVTSVPAGSKYFTLYWKFADGQSGFEEARALTVPIVPGSISGTKYQDENADGIANGTDAGLSGWTVKLYADVDGSHTLNAGDTLVATQVTGAGGGYTFSNVDPGDYIVVEVQQNTWHQSGPATDVDGGFVAGQGENGYSVHVGNGEVVTGKDFFNWQESSISGHKFEDNDADGTHDAGEAGLVDWGIGLVADANGNGVVDAGDTLVDVTFTDSNGAYTFTGVGPGKYIIVEESISGWTQSAPTTDVDGTNIAGATEDGYAITVTSGDSIANKDFLNYRSASISGTKYQDENADGAANGADAGLSGWTISLYKDVNGDGKYDAGDSFVTSTTTDGNGDYSFNNLTPDKYVVLETQQSGWHQSGPGTDVDGGLASKAENGYAVTLASGDSATDKDFFNWQESTVSGHKFEDENANGTKDVGDNGLSGWTISLYKDVNGDGKYDAGDTFVTSQVTGAGGAYSFTGVEPGKYIILETLQTDWHQSGPGTDVDGGLASKAENGYAIEVTSGDTIADKDFLNYKLGSISGQKWADIANFGVKDAGELGIPGWTIRLYTDANHNGMADDGESFAETQTDGSGNFHFDNLLPGTDYVLVEVMQPHYTQTFPGTTLVDNTTADLGQYGYDISITSSDVVTGKDFGNHLEGTQVRTPGFWQNVNNGGSFWDGLTDVNNPKAGTAGFPTEDLIILGNTLGGAGQADDYILIGDWSGNGQTDAGEHTLKILRSEAFKMVGNEKDTGDGRWVLARDLVATWLNKLAGSDTTEVHAYIDEAVDFLNATTNLGDGKLDTGDFTKGTAVKQSSAAWQLGIDVNGGGITSPLTTIDILAGSQLHTALDHYNNTGFIF